MGFWGGGHFVLLALLHSCGFQSSFFLFLSHFPSYAWLVHLFTISLFVVRKSPVLSVRTFFDIVLFLLICVQCLVIIGELGQAHIRC